MKSINCPLIALAIGLFSHAKAGEPPRLLESLTTTKGRTYEKVEIREITPSGIKIAHDSGTATIPFQELSEKLQQDFGGFDPQAAEEHVKKQDRAVHEQENAIEAELVRIQQTAEKKPTTPEKSAPKATTQARQNPPRLMTDPAGLVGTPFGEMPTDPYSAGENPPSAEPTPAPKTTNPAPASQIREKGILSARIVGYRSGIKRVEFKVMANCPAKLEVHQVVPDEHSPVAHTDTFAVTANTNFVREIWVYNNYSADLYNEKGERLDDESTDKKSNLGGLARPTLR